MESAVALPSVPLTASPLDRATPLNAAELVRATAGWLGLAAVALASSPERLGEGVPLSLAAPAGALLLTAPALLVGHQFLDLRASPRPLLGLVIGAYGRAGDVALGIIPVALLFSATSALGPVILMMGVLGASFHSLLVTWKRLIALERGAWSEGISISAQGRMVLLSLGWAALTALIGLRLCWDLANAVL